MAMAGESELPTSLLAWSSGPGFESWLGDIFLPNRSLPTRSAFNAAFTERGIPSLALADFILIYRVRLIVTQSFKRALDSNLIAIKHWGLLGVFHPSFFFFMPIYQDLELRP